MLGTASGIPLSHNRYGILREQEGASDTGLGEEEQQETAVPIVGIDGVLLPKPKPESRRHLAHLRERKDVQLLTTAVKQAREERVLLQLTSPVAQPPHQSQGAAQPDVVTPAATPSDRLQVSAASVADLQQLTQSFTLDACYSSCSNAVQATREVHDSVAGMASEFDPFSDHSVVGNHVWLHAPFSQLSQYIEHYVLQKQTQPHTTSACILVPFRGKPVHSALSAMRVVRYYPKGYHLFEGAAEGGKRKRVPGLPWPVGVYYDPPAPQPASGYAMLFKGAVYGKEVAILADTGGTDNYVSEALCRQMGIALKADPISVTLGNNTEHTSCGVARLKLHVQGYKAIMPFHALPLPPGVDFILGDTWMKNNKAQLLMAEGQLKIRCGGHIITLNNTWPEQKPDASVPQPSSEEHYLQVLSSTQAKRSLRKNKRHFLVYVKWAAPPAAEGEDAQWDFASKVGTHDTCANPAKVVQLLRRFKDVFPKELSYMSLPPEREINHTIPLQPGAKPVFRPMYRYSPRELQEMETQITELLRLGLIEPCNSPWGSPVLFVPKKGGKLRMCFDGRWLNKVTVRHAYPLPRVDDLLDRLHGATCFSGLDLMSGYHQIRIAPEDQEKSAFRTPFGLYKWKVLCFGLVNAPAVFVQMMDSVFRSKGMNTYVVVYLDDILVYSKTPGEHLQHLESVLQTLADNKLYANFEKCAFNNPEVEYLGHVVSADGIKPDPKKVQAVLQWPRPTTKKELRSFLGLTQYFRKFIQGYSKIAAPLNALLKEDVDWRRPNTWCVKCTAAFHTLKQHLTAAPVLAMPDFTKPFEVVCDASIVAVGAVLMQGGRPIAFESRKLTGAEYNYFTSEQELLAVVHALTVWRCYLEGVKFKVVTDHHPNTFFSSQIHLSRRQARWSEFLQQFDFDWQYRPGRTNVADPLSRLVWTDGPSPAAVALVTTSELGSVAEGASHDPPDAIIPPLLQRISDSYRKDPWFTHESNTGALTYKDGLWYKDTLVVVPADDSIKGDILHEAHDSVYAGHFGLHKTLHQITRRFWWPQIRAAVQTYVTGCVSCQANKSAHSLPPGKLQPLPIPDGKWDWVTVDFVTQLPETDSGHDAICVFCDKLTKMVHLVPTLTTVTAQQTAHMFVQQVWRLHGIPAYLVSDRGPQFDSELFRDIMKLLGVQQAMSTAYHPQTDGQTERVNRVVEEAIRHYVNPTQTDWDTFLPCVEFAINHAVHSSTRQSPFFLNYGIHPHTPLSRQSPVQKAVSTRLPAAVKFAADMQGALDRAKRCLQSASDRMKEYKDLHRVDLEFQEGDMVWLHSKNIAVKHKGTRKFGPKWLGPFEVVQCVGPVAYKLSLPPTMARVHPVFHVSLLKPYIAPERAQPPPPPVIMADGELEYEVTAVIGHRLCGKAKKLQYQVRFAGYGAEHDEWLPVAQLNCDELIQQYLNSPAYQSNAEGIVQKHMTKQTAVAKQALRQQRSAQPKRQKVSAQAAPVPVAPAQADAPVRRSSRIPIVKLRD